MYSLHRNINLVTIASNVDENFAVSNAGNDAFSDFCAVIHEGCVNILPLIETKGAIAKYIPVNRSKNRGKGVVKQVRWVEVEDKKVFVIASSAGLQIYEKDFNDICFEHACNEAGDCSYFITGICGLVNGRFVAIGTNLGNIWLFRYDISEQSFALNQRLYGHDEAVSQLDGYGRRFVSCSSKTVYLWELQLPINHGQWDIIRKLSVPGLFASPTSLKYTNDYILIGYESGEFCVFGLLSNSYTIRMVAHRLKVTAIDFVSDANLILTASMDQYVKVWEFKEKLQEDAEYECLQSICNEDGPVCGARFLNKRGTEFCTVTANELVVKNYLKNIKSFAPETDLDPNEYKKYV